MSQTSENGSTIDFGRMTQALQTEFFDVYEKAQSSKSAGDDKRYKAWLDSLWKVARVLVDLKNLQRNLDASGEDANNEFAKLLEKITEDERLSQEEKKALMSIKDAHSSKLR